MSPFDLSARAALAGVCVWAGLSTAMAAPLYTVTEIGVLPGCDGSAATAVSDRSDVVGYCAPAALFNPAFLALGDGVKAFAWRDGVLRDLGVMKDGHYSYATAVNAFGTVVGDGDSGNYNPEAWVTSASGLQNIFPNKGGNTRTALISDVGAIGGSYTKSGSGALSSWRGAVWTPDPKDPRKYRMTTLPIIAGGIDAKNTVSIPFAFNQSTQAVGWASTDQTNARACFWNIDATRSVMYLGMLAGDYSSYAEGINDFGQAVGFGQSYSSPDTHPILWSSNAEHTASPLPLLSGGNYGRAIDINNLGHVIGVSNSSAHTAEPVVWRDGEVFSLNNLLDATTGNGWSIDIVSDINNAGQIVGVGTRNDVSRAILLSPVQP